MSLERAVESKIQEAMAAGAFDNLRGAGKPLAVSEEEKLAGESWLGYRLLRENGFLPEWLMLAREIEGDLRELARLDERHERLVAHAGATGEWLRNAGAIRHTVQAYATLARAIRRKQDQFNLDAPAIVVERPAIWVEWHLERLASRLVAAGAPEGLLAPSV